MFRIIGYVFIAVISHVAFAQEREVDIGAVRSEFIQPVPYPVGLDSRKVALGDMLFHDVRLSGDNSISCASCHSLDHAGVDSVPRSLGVNGVEGEMNAPTVFNSGLNFSQFWDGKASTLEEQVGVSMNSPAEMASNWPLVIGRLKADSDYVVKFAAIYGDINAANVRDAIAAFERSLNTVDSRFDQFLRGDEQAINESEKKGYELFKSYGCVACHQGQNVGGNLFQKFGVMGDSFSNRDTVRKADLGRFNVSGDELDQYVFKVPSLRLVVLTAPYFHDGSVKTLHQAIDLMALYQLGLDIPEEDVKLIISFLHSLVGNYKGKALE